MIECKICLNTFKSYVSLAHHLTKKHKVSTQEYYNDFLSDNENDGKCVICNNETSFINIRKGYRITCCNSHSAILRRKNLKENRIKFNKFRNKVSKNQSKIWKDREKSGEKEIILKNVSKSLKIYVKSLSKEEKIKRFGWLNNIKDEKERQHFISKITKPLKEYSEKNSPSIEKIMSEYNLYRNKITSLTKRTYKKHKNILNPNNLPRGKGKGKYHIDHKYSVLEGFKNNIDPLIISSIYNLQLLKSTDNIRKRQKCSISKRKLLETYDAFS